MALSTYNELRQSIANWADRDDLTGFIPDFIALCEARYTRDLRLRAMEQKQYATTIGGQSNYALPVNYLQMREFRLNQEPTISLTYVSPEIFEAWSLGQGMPKFYTIIANEIRIGPTPAGAYEMEMLFWQKFPPLSSTNPNNWMLLNSPDIYLYGSLMELEPFIQNDPRTSLWANGYTNAVQTLQLQDDKDRHSGSALTVQS